MQTTIASPGRLAEAAAIAAGFVLLLALAIGIASAVASGTKAPADAGAIG